MNKTEFMIGRIRVPRCVNSDAYTVAGEILSSSQAREKSVYNFTNRYSPTKAWPEVAKDSRMIFYGLTEFIREHLTKPITDQDINDADEFMKTAHSFGGPLKFDRKIWERVLTEFNGFLPIKIEAIEEGSTFFPFEPIIQVTSLVEGFGEIAAHIEPLMVGMVSIASARATLCRHWLERIKEWCKLDDNEAMAQFVIHDFGMRASSCAEENELIGKAHLLVFHGTDTFSAAYQARKMGAKVPTGTSILALAHRIVQGYDKEGKCHENLANQGVVGSHVSDCFNFKDCVENLLIPLAKSHPDYTVINRPDSGPYLENDIWAIKKCLENGLVKAVTKEADTIYEPTNFKNINGDSITPRKQELIYRERKKNGFAPTKWGIFGVGGYLRNNCTRDSLSSAYKLAAKSNEDIPVMKLSDVRGKMSIPGPSVLRRWEDKTRMRPTVFLQQKDFHSFGVEAYRTYYNAAKHDVERYGDECIRDFSVLQGRCIKGFNEYDEFSSKWPEFGLPSQTCLSDVIVDMQEKLLEEHK